MPPCLRFHCFSHVQVANFCNHQPSTINHQQTITQPQNPETHSLHPFRIFRIFQIQGTRLLVLASLGGVSVPPLPGRGSHPGQATRWEHPRTQPAAANSTTPWRERKTPFSVVLFCVCVYMFLCVKVSTDQKNKNKIVKKFSS